MVTQNHQGGWIGPARRGQRDADTVLAHHPGKLVRKLAGNHRVETEAAVVAADQHRHQWARERRESFSPFGRGGGEAGLGHPVERGSGDQDVGAGQLVMAVDHDKIEAGRGHARMLHLHHRGPAAAQCGADRSGNAPAADRQIGKWRPDLAANGGQCVRPQRGGEPAPGWARGEPADSRHQPGGLGQSDRLRLQAGIILAEDPGVGGIGHRPRNTGRRFSL